MTETRELVYDRTGLSGQFDLAFKSAPGLANTENATADLPTFTTAVREQLGLRLDRSTDNVDVLVIEHVTEPTPD